MTNQAAIESDLCTLGNGYVTFSNLMQLWHYLNLKTSLACQIMASPSTD